VKRDPKRPCPDCGKPMTALFNVFSCEPCEDKRKKKAAECNDCECDGKCSGGDECCNNKKAAPKKDGCGGCGGCP